MQEVLETWAEQIGLSLTNISLGGIRLAANSVPGDAIVPGTIDATRLNPFSFPARFSRKPGPDEALGLSFAPSTTMDRWVKGTNDEGPGRIRRVSRVSTPPGYQPGPGPTRYRIVRPNMKFGVMALRMRDDGTPTECEIFFGVVLANIPHPLGRVPQLIETAWSGTAPSAFALRTNEPSQFQVWSNTRLFHDRAKATYEDANFPFLTAFGDASDPLLYPLDTDWEDNQGITVQLITGTNADEVYRQLNTLPGRGVVIGEPGEGPADSFPKGLPILPAATANVLRWDGDSPPGQLNWDHLDESTDLSTQGRVAQGVPFAYEDCDRIKATDSTFSLLVKLRFVKQKELNNNWASPDQWHTIGVETVGGGQRDWGLDVIIE